MTSIVKVQIYLKEVLLKRIGGLLSGEYYTGFFMFQSGLRK